MKRIFLGKSILLPYPACCANTLCKIYEYKFLYLQARSNRDYSLTSKYMSRINQLSTLKLF